MDLRERRELASSAAGRHPWELARLRVVERLLNSRLRGRQPELILDIGCGDAFVAEELSRLFPDAHIAAVDTELDDETTESLSARLSSRRVSLYRSLDEAAAQHGPADIVLLLDVIEHIADDVSFLQVLRSSPLVTPQTMFLITVPAHQGLFCSHDVFLGHYRRYNNTLLRDHLAAAGYETDEVGYFFFTALGFRLLEAGKERWQSGSSHRATGLAAWQGGPLATTLVRLMLQADFACSRILRRVGLRLPGLSNYALCKTSAS